MHRFKIDLYDSSYGPFGLYVGRPCWYTKLSGIVRWKLIDCFPTRDEAKALHEKIKDLPEYLE